MIIQSRSRYTGKTIINWEGTAQAAKFESKTTSSVEIELIVFCREYEIFCFSYLINIEF